MVRYLKYIVLVFGTIGIIIASFFYFQNKTDIHRAFSYKSKIDFKSLRVQCHAKVGESVFPCLKSEFTNSLVGASLTGTSFGMKMVFNVLDEDKDQFTVVRDSNIKNFIYSIHYLEVNNLAIGNVYKNYFGFSFLYGGFLTSLQQYLKKANRFSQEIITGLEGPKGLMMIDAKKEHSALYQRFEEVKKKYYLEKVKANKFIENKWAELSNKE